MARCVRCYRVVVDDECRACELRVVLTDRAPASPQFSAIVTSTLHAPNYLFPITSKHGLRRKKREGVMSRIRHTSQHARQDLPHPEAATL
jgi:hypothetical protein